MAIRTNLCTNPSFETITWGSFVNGQPGSSMAVSAAQAKYGSNSCLLTNTGTSSDDCFMTKEFTGLTTGTSHTISGYRYVTLKNAAAYNNRAILSYAAGVTNVTDTTDTTYALNTWVRFSVTLSTGAGTTLEVRLYAVPGTCYWDGILIEETTSVKPYFDGASSLGGYTYAWTGSVNASSSTETTVAFSTPRFFAMF